MDAFLHSGVETLQDLWPQAVGFAHFLIAALTSLHVVLTKEDTKAASAWVGLVWLSPFLGAAVYYVLGINRIRRKALSARVGSTVVRETFILSRRGSVAASDFKELVTLGDHLSLRPLTDGNRIRPLANGDEAYPQMLSAIRQAETSVALSSYIFDNDSAGQEFLHALGDAHKRGIQIRVLVDATGARYSFPSITRPLRQLNIQSALFMPNSSLRKVGTINLRSHRKILVIDGKIAFTGGLNIREGNILERKPKHPIQDLHFRCDGPVVAHIRQAFIEDWAFTTGEVLSGTDWLPNLVSAGDILARGILDGPDENYEKILYTILGAMSRAKKTIRILTPYFLPDQSTIRMLSIAAMSGIEIDIIIPERNNIVFVQWATFATIGPLLRHGVRIHLSKPPFDHSKLVLVDDSWVFVGSANWDSRSLQLNFEFNVECYSESLSAEMQVIFRKKLTNSRLISWQELQDRPLPVKIRDGAVRLFAPYL